MGKTGIKPLDRWANKISRIDRMELIDCTPNAYVVAIGVAVAAFHIFWAIGGPECVDSAWDRVNRGGKKHRSFKARGATVGPTIGPKPGKFGATLIGIGDAGQKIGFGIGLVDGFLDGVYYGSSLIRRYSGCLNPTAPYAEFDMHNQVPLLLPATTAPISQWNVIGRRGMGAGPTGPAVGPDQSQLLTVTYTLSQDFNRFPPLPDCQFTSWLQWQSESTPVWTNYGGLGWLLNASGVYHGRDIGIADGGGNLWVVVQKTEGVFFIKDASFRVTGGKALSNMDAYSCGQ